MYTVPTARSAAKDSSNVKYTVTYFPAKPQKFLLCLPGGHSCTSQFKDDTNPRHMDTCIDIYSPVSNKGMQAIKDLYDMHLACFGCGFFPLPLKIVHNNLLVSHKNSPEHASFQALSFLSEVYASGKTRPLGAANLNLTDVIRPQMKMHFH